MLNDLMYPFICAAIGYLTNWIAIKCLFHPHKSYILKGFRNKQILVIQGLIPKKKEEIAKNVSENITKYFFDSDKLLKRIESDLLRRLTREKIKKFVKKNVKMWKPLEWITEFYIDECLSLSQLRKRFLANFDEISGRSIKFIQKHIEQEILDYDERQIEEIMYENASREFRFIIILGGILGFIFGCILILV